LQAPNDYVYRLSGGSHLVAEEKGLWTWIKSHILFRNEYRLPWIIDRVANSQSLGLTGECVKFRLDCESKDGLKFLALYVSLMDRVALYNEKHPNAISANPKIEELFLRTAFLPTGTSKTNLLQLAQCATIPVDSVAEQAITDICKAIPLGIEFSNSKRVKEILGNGSKEALAHLRTRLDLEICGPKAPSNIEVLSRNLSLVKDVIQRRFGQA